MSGESNSNKTELPTKKKIQDARKEGNFLFAETVVHFCTLFTGIGAVYLVMVEMPYRFDRLLSATIYLMRLENFNNAVSDFFTILMREMLPPSAMVFITVAVFSIIGNVMQVGFVFQGAKLKKGLEYMNPVTNVKNLFSKQTLTKFVLSIIKICLILFISYKLMIDDVAFSDRVFSHRLDILSAMVDVGMTLWKIMMITLLSLIPIAMIDYGTAWLYYRQDNMMSKDEVKREHKEEEGDPEVKSHRKAIGRELIESPDRLGGASAVIRNPTHIAVVVRYEPNTSPMPYITEMAEGRLAKAIIKRAEAMGVPLYEDIPFARAIFAKGKVDTHIPVELSEKVVSFVYWLQNKHPDRVFDQPEFTDILARIGDVKH